MSDMEYHAGTAREIFPLGKTVNEIISWLKSKGHIIDSVDEWTDGNGNVGMYIESETVCVLFNNRFFAIDDVNIENEIIAKKDKDGLFSYTLAWYNGGAGFDEVLEEAIKKEEKNLLTNNDIKSE